MRFGIVVVVRTVGSGVVRAEEVVAAVLLMLYSEMTFA